METLLLNKLDTATLKRILKRILKRNLPIKIENQRVYFTDGVELWEVFANTDLNGEFDVIKIEGNAVILNKSDVSFPDISKLANDRGLNKIDMIYYDFISWFIIRLYLMYEITLDSERVKDIKDFGFSSIERVSCVTALKFKSTTRELIIMGVKDCETKKG